MPAGQKMSEDNNDDMLTHMGGAVLILIGCGLVAWFAFG